MNRIDRLAAIMIQLQGKRLIKAQHIATRFNISLRTVYRDVHALQEAGVPIIGEAGSGYQLMEGYKLPPVMFTEDEASALLTGGKLMQHMSDEPLWKQYASALDKIKAVLRYAEKDFIEEIDAHVAVLPPPFLYRKKTELHLPQLLKAIAAAMVVEVDYTSAEKKETKHRNVEPVGIYYQGNYWYLVAWCRLRNDYRNFRTDNISRLFLTSEKVTGTHPPLQHFINQTTEKRQLQKVVIDVKKEVIKYFGEQKYYNGFVSEEAIGDEVRMTFLCGSLTGFAKWFLLFGEHAVIREPLALNELVLQLISRIGKKIEQTVTLLT